MTGKHLDLSSDPDPESGNRFNSTVGQGRGRPFLGIHFACCGVYARLYLDANQTAYTGHCPHCSRRIQFRIGPEGTEQRFFTAY